MSGKITDNAPQILILKVYIKHLFRCVNRTDFEDHEGIHKT